MMTQGASVHASAVLVGDRAVLIRGPSGAGKSRLAFDLILAGRAGQLPPAVLVGDDRVHLDTVDGQLWVRPARELAGLIEIRGLGIRRCDFAIKAIVGIVVDLAAERCGAAAAAGSALYSPKRCFVTANPCWNGLCPPPADCSRADDNRKFRFRPTFG